MTSRSLRLTSAASLVACLILLGCGGAQSSANTTPEPTPQPSSNCPEGTHMDDCAHGSCPNCDDCVAECVAN